LHFRWAWRLAFRDFMLRIIAMFVLLTFAHAYAQTPQDHHLSFCCQRLKRPAGIKRRFQGSLTAN
jgi:hypothetical protein